MAVQNQRDSKSTKATKTTTSSATSSTTTPKKSNKTAKKLADYPASMKMPTAAATSMVANQQQQQPNGGPRVSFNRDVHVKRIAKHPNEVTNFELSPSTTTPTTLSTITTATPATTNIHPSQQQQQQSYHHLASDYSVENINKEAALVLQQAGSYKSKAENGDNIPTFRVKTKVSGPKKFHSLPNRKKKNKPVTRSVSDASGKKLSSKRTSIFSLFSRKSDSNVNQVERDPRFEDSGGRRLVRSKSDVGSASTTTIKKLKKSLKDTKTAPGTGTLSSTQLSPIIENAQKEDYFAEQFNRERRKSEAITEREKHENALKDVLEEPLTSHNNTANDKFLGKNQISNSIKAKILTLQARSNENMHSSQLPAQKLPLTKGRTVNGMVKRLSMERFSPPPTMTQPAFSYIRPNEGLSYGGGGEPEQVDRQHRQNSVQRLRSPTREIRQTPVRDFRSPERERELLLLPNMHKTNTLNRTSVDRTDYHTSQNNLKNTNNNYSSSIHIHDSFLPRTGATTIRISSSHSPSPWQQLSPRNLSDEDEGLGIETRKYYDDDVLNKTGSKSPGEPPIVPVIRSITPPREMINNGYHHHHTHHNHYSREDLDRDDLGYRRQRLESRILTRRFGDAVGPTIESNGYHRQTSPERYRLQRYLSAEPDLSEQRYHKPQTAEIINKYSPERSHLDIIAPATTSVPLAPVARSITPPTKKSEKTSRYKHTKYYDDGHGGVKETYERQTHLGDDGKPIVRESRHRERFDSYNHNHHSPIAITNGNGARDYNSAERQQLLNDYEPKSLDSQFTYTDQYRSSPEYMKRYELSAERNLQHTSALHNDERNWQSSLKRDKLQQRSFDKGDSGIENDFRKESFNGDITTRWRKRSVIDDIKACEAFLKKERRHTEQQEYENIKNNYSNSTRHRTALAPPSEPTTTLNDKDHHYIYRERSIDDGSHYDPHLDKYPVATSTLRRRDQHSQTGQGQDTNNNTNNRGGSGNNNHNSNTNSNNSTLKRTNNKKLGGFEKVKQLFIGKDTKKDNSNSNNSHSNSVDRHLRANSTTSSSAGGGIGSGGGGTNSMTTTTTTTTRRTLPTDKTDKYMVKEEEMRSRYREHRANALHNEPKATDISMRRRLSTPKASPLLLKRTSSDKTKKTSPLAKPEKISWFKSLDRRAKSKSKEKLNVSVNGLSETSSIKRSTNKLGTPTTSATKNLRFFGDTDLDSNPPTISKANSNLQIRQPIPATLNRSQKYSQSAYHLDRLNNSPQHLDYRHTLAFQGKSNARNKSSSLHNLNKNEHDKEGEERDEVDFRNKRRHYSRSRDLDDISESGSETENQHKRNDVGLVGGRGGRTLSRERLDRSHRYDEHTYRRSNDRQNTSQLSSTPNESGGGGIETRSNTHQQRRSHLMGPPKPARSAERRLTSSYSRDRDRFPAESSGTEGESSLQSQRSVVYLHATTVGAIPQPYYLRRRSISRDDLRSNKSKQQQQLPLQPMTRTVSRSVSMLAPWKPKLISEGYEINYSQEQNKNMAASSTTLPRHQHLNANAAASTLTRNNMRNKSETPSRRLHQHDLQRHDQLKDDQSSLRNSSTTSANTNLRRKIK